MKKLFLTLALVLTVIFVNNSFAQITGNITAKGIVLSPISITATRDLDFGDDIIPGIARTIDKTATSSGKFSLAGQALKELNVTLTTPTELVNGANNLPISFTATDAGYKTPTGTLTAFDPAAPINASFGSEGTMDVFLGGKVTPASNQVAGLYTATVNISLYYTGN